LEIPTVTVMPPLGAALLRVTVQVLEAFGASEDGLQATDDTVIAVTRLTVV
jgi:hypothetical protein